MEKEEIWSKALNIALSGVDSDDPKSVFINLLTPFGIFGDQFILLAENAQVESWVKKNYVEDIRRAVEQASGYSYQIGISSKTAISGGGSQQPAAQPDFGAVSVPSPQQQPQTDFGTVSAQHAQQPQQFAAQQQPQPQQQQQDVPEWMNTYINPADLPGVQRQQARPQRQQLSQGERNLFEKCSFETFVVGKSNEFARGAALAVAEQPGIAYNPLFIYGSSGLGKTHLLVAIANYAQQNFPQMAVCYVSANQFLNDYVEATQHNAWAGFNSRYHQADILLMDDVQYLEGKDETINQLFNIFNEMRNQNKQIVLSADRAPKDIDMDERMRSRFVSGLLADIKPPDYETRLAILKNYLHRVEETTNFFGVIPDDVLAYLAETATSNIREMEGAINRLVSNISLCNKTTVDIDEARVILQDFFPDTANRKASIGDIQSEVERFFGISHEDMISSKRAKTITYPRHIAIYLSRYMTEESLESIGKKFGGRDHTTIMHSVNKIEKDQKDNRLLFDQLEQLTIRIKERS